MYPAFCAARGLVKRSHCGRLPLENGDEIVVRPHSCARQLFTPTAVWEVRSPLSEEPLVVTLPAVQPTREMLAFFQQQWTLGARWPLREDAWEGDAENELHWR